MKKEQIIKEIKTIPYDQKLALSLISKYGIKLATIERWQKEGKMPKRYFEKKEIFMINGKTILQHRVNSGLSQIQFIISFNQRFNMDLTSVSLSNWENGKGMPRKAYQNLLIQYYSK